METAGSSSSSVNESTDLRLTSLLINAIKTSPSQRLTLANIYSRLVELNPSLKERRTDWQGTVRHTLSASTLFARIGKARAGHWTINPNGDRSTHKNRRAKRSKGSPEVANSAVRPSKKRLGVTRRSSEVAPLSFNRSMNSVSLSINSKGQAASSTTFLSAPKSNPSFLPLSERQSFTTLDCPSTKDRFIDEPPPPALVAFQPEQVKRLPSQFVDTKREAFPPMPRLDAHHSVYSQSSSSISFSQSQSQSQ